jgi:hypothetical protein
VPQNIFGVDEVASAAEVDQGYIDLFSQRTH